MWYSGGEQYEPDAIGYATSPDGIHWTKRPSTRSSQADPAGAWEQHKVTACQVVPRDGWFYMFYIGFRDIDHAAIGIARSRDGVTGWERLPQNPIVSPTPGRLGRGRLLQALRTFRRQDSGGSGTMAGTGASSRSAWSPKTARTSGSNNTHPSEDIAHNEDTGTLFLQHGGTGAAGRRRPRRPARSRPSPGAWRTASPSGCTR